MKAEAIKALVEVFPYTNKQIALIVGCTTKYSKMVLNGDTAFDVELNYEAVTNEMLSRKAVVDDILSLRHWNTIVDGRAIYRYIGLLSWIDVPYHIIKELFFALPESLLSMGYNYGKHKVKELDSTTIGMPKEVFRRLFITEKEEAEMKRQQRKKEQMAKRKLTKN